LESQKSVELLLELFNNYVEEGNEPKLTYFMQHMNVLAREHVKPLCSRSSASKSGGTNKAKDIDSNDWKVIQKSRYSGRGRKWVKVSIEEILPTLDGFDESGIDTSNYRAWIANAGFAWVRYRSPKLIRGKKFASFEVPLNDSRVNHPHFLHFIDDSELDNYEIMNETPFSMGLENRSRGEDIQAPEKSSRENDGEEIIDEEIDEEEDDTDAF